ncbi:ecto-NOX disulfide-thiol exchanger 1-like [Puntigrus tetrazona]|uniref:ecto-NOX disulfide-thiol exchanger 1-like n=1 Tax=Puntigrus tetrazona TaxID=1606681 RepID=UPI001C8A9984|nr:ecto-NOX disulfide-thiol exchanger 1-like [Puntigrus tetrazona]
MVGTPQSPFLKEGTCPSQSERTRHACCRRVSQTAPGIQRPEVFRGGCLERACCGIERVLKVFLPAPPCLIELSFPSALLLTVWQGTAFPFYEASDGVLEPTMPDRTPSSAAASLTSVSTMGWEFTAHDHFAGDFTNHSSGPAHVDQEEVAFHVHKLDSESRGWSCEVPADCYPNPEHRPLTVPPAGGGPGRWLLFELGPARSMGQRPDHQALRMPARPQAWLHGGARLRHAFSLFISPDDNKFSEATAVLFTWIDRGEVNRRSANHFYSMIQSANSHVRRLMNEKAQHEEEMELAKEHFKNSLLAILTQFEQITAVFTAATRQKAWDHFSKAQRKNIDIWRKQCEELRNAHSEEIMGIRREEEMEMSDEDLEENPCKKMRMEDTVLSAQTCALREENDSLRWQLDAYRNEVELLKKEQGKMYRTEEDHTQEQQLHFLQQTMQNMQQQLLRLQEELKGKELELEQARDEQHYLEGEVLSLREKLLNAMESVDLTNHNSEGHEKGVNGTATLYHHREKNNDMVIWGPLRSEKEALLLGIISTFLHVHPFGANIEYLWSYIQRLDTKISASELERLMVRLPNMFKQEFSGVGATLEKRWKFCGFEALKSL